MKVRMMITMKRYTFLVLISAFFAQITYCPSAGLANVESGGYSRPLPNSILAYLSTSQSTLIFEASEAQISSVIAMQGLSAQFPETIPDGFKRAHGFDLRKNSIGILTSEQEKLMAYFEETSTATYLQDGSVEHRGDIPVAMLGDITYASTLYSNEDGSEEVMYLVRITTPDAYRGYIQGGLEEGGEDSMEFTRIVGDTTFLIFVPALSVETLRDETCGSQSIVIYELSSCTTPLEVIKRFLFAS